jgi:hypothetical protein
MASLARPPLGEPSSASRKRQCVILKKYHAFRHAFRHVKKKGVNKSHAFRHAFHAMRDQKRDEKREIFVCVF